MIVCMRIVLEMRSRDELDFKLVRLNWLFPKGSDGCTFSTCATIIGSAVISELPPSSLVQQDTLTTIPASAGVHSTPREDVLFQKISFLNDET